MSRVSRMPIMVLHLLFSVRVGLFDEALYQMWFVQLVSHCDSGIDMELRIRTAGARGAKFGD